MNATMTRSPVSDPHDILTTRQRRDLERLAHREGVEFVADDAFDGRVRMFVAGGHITATASRIDENGRWVLATHHERNSQWISCDMPPPCFDYAFSYAGSLASLRELGIRSYRTPYAAFRAALDRDGGAS